MLGKKVLLSVLVSGLVGCSPENDNRIVHPDVKDGQSSDASVM